MKEFLIQAFSELSSMSSDYPLGFGLWSLINFFLWSLCDSLAYIFESKILKR